MRSRFFAWVVVFHFIDLLVIDERPKPFTPTEMRAKLWYNNNQCNQILIHSCADGP